MTLLNQLSVFSDLGDLLSQTSASFKGTLIIIPILIILCLVCGSIVKKQDSVRNPSTLCVLCEWLVGWINSFCEELLGSRWRKFAPWIVTAGLFIFVANISGLFLCFFNLPDAIMNYIESFEVPVDEIYILSFTAPTANICITLALGLITGFLAHFAGIKDQGFVAYFKSTYMEPLFIFLPMNIISELLNPVSLALRLFGNILSGGVIMGLVYACCVGVFADIFPVAGVLLGGAIAPALHAIFDIFFGAIQAYVFMLLSAVFISNKLGDDDPNYVPIYS